MRAALLALAVGGTGGWSYVLLERTPSWEPWLRRSSRDRGRASAALALGARRRGVRARELGAATAVLALVACLAGPVAYAAQTISTAHTGSIPSAGPTSRRASRRLRPGGARSARGPPAAAPAAPAAPRRLRRGRPGPAAAAVAAARWRGTSAGGGGARPAAAALVAALERDAARTAGSAATSGSQSAATLELATGGDPVMAIGGFNGNGGNLTLAQFETYVQGR